MIKIMNIVTGVCILVHVCDMSRTVVRSYKKGANILLCMHYNTGRQKTATDTGAYDISRMRYIAFTNNHEGKERREAPGGHMAGRDGTYLHTCIYVHCSALWMDR